MSAEGAAIAAELKAAQMKKLKSGVARIEALQDQLADIGTSIKSELKILEDAGLDKRVVKECIKRGKRDDRQVALFDMQLLQYENALGRQRKLDLAQPPEAEPDDVDGSGGDGDEKVVPIGKGKKAKASKKKPKAEAEPTRAAAADAVPAKVKRGAFKDVTPRMSAAEYRRTQGIDDEQTKR